MWAASRTQPIALATGRRMLVSSTHAVNQKQSDFLMWMKDRGEEIDCFNVDIGMSKHGRALFAVRGVCAGECMMKFSQDLVLIAEKLPKEITSLVTTTNEFSRLSLLVMAEKHKAEKSAWAPYIECLPSIPEVHNTVFWDEEETGYLWSSRVHRETFRRKTTISTEFKANLEVMQAHPNIFGENVTLDQFMLAYAAVSSRAWGAGPHGDLTMVPFVDFANHNPLARTIFDHDKISKTTMVIADRDYESGEEVCISYGNHSNGLLALDFGFCVPNNPFDEVEIWLEIPLDDPLRERKLKLLVQNNMNTVMMPGGSESGHMPFAIEAVQEKGEFIPAAARAFARVISAHSIEDLEALEHEASTFGTPLGFKPRMDALKEMQAMRVIAMSVENNILDHLDAIQALHNSTLRPERLEVAKLLLDGELSLLRKALLLLVNQ